MSAFQICLSAFQFVCLIAIVKLAIDCHKGLNELIKKKGGK